MKLPKGTELLVFSCAYYRILEAVKDVKQKGEKSSKLKFLRENVPWVVPLIEAAIKIKGTFGV